MQEVNNLPIAGILQNSYDHKDIRLLSNHVSKASLLQFASIDALPDFGNRDLYALAYKEESPFMLPQIEGGQIVNISGNEYTFNVPSVGKDETKLVSIDGVQPGQKIGQLGIPFWITENNVSLGSNGEQIMPSLHRDFALQVLDVRSKGANTEHWQYQVVFNGNATGAEHIPQDVLQPGKLLYKIGGTRSREHGQEWDSWMIKGGQNRKYVARISDYQLQVHYKMTREACIIADTVKLDKEWLTKNFNRVTELIGVKKDKDGALLNPLIKTVDDYVKFGGDIKQLQPGQKLGFKFLTTEYDRISMSLLRKESDLMQVYHPGGWTGLDGFDKSYIHPGVFHQFNYSGVRHTFDPRFVTRNQIIAAIDAFRAGSEIPTTFGKEVAIKIRTGDGGGYILNKIFEKEFLANMTAQVFAKELGAFSGTYQTGLKVFTPWFAGIKIAGKYDITWEIDPSLNGSMIDPLDNPLVNGHRLFSYTMIIEDADYSASNIKIVRREGLSGNMSMQVVPGTFTHPFFQNEYMGAALHQGAHTGTGFTAHFIYEPETAIVWDPTRMLKFSPINPYTGLSPF